MEEKPGYIPIFRKFFEHYLWQEKREFSKAEAWIDCIQLARYKKGKKKKLIAGNLIEWDYGQFPASVRFLKERWGWGSNTKVERFLKLLQDDEMIVIKKGQGQNVITLCNYSSYDIRNNDQKDRERTEKGHRKDGGKTEGGRNSNKGKKGNKGKKEKVTPLTASQVMAKQVCEYLLEAICEHDPDHRYNSNPPSLESNNWMNEVDRAIRLDKRTEEQLKFVIDTVFRKKGRVGSFWAPNIQSGKKLRDKFDHIKGQIKQERDSQKNGTNAQPLSRADREIQFQEYLAGGGASNPL